MPFTVFQTSFGACAIAWEGGLVSRFHLPEGTAEKTKARVASRGAIAVGEEVAPEWVRRVIERVRRHLDGDLHDFSDVPLDWPRVTAFQRAVYEQTRAIKPGFTREYGEIAGALAPGSGSARAVGAALGANPWPLLVPCHRVVSAGDRMTGFSGPGGVRTKTRLLALEGAELLSE
jgi:methylated-DNA-[protein]-cysteine S-methyltransferase